MLRNCNIIKKLTRIPKKFTTSVEFYYSKKYKENKGR